jgi:hypothetical protein
VLDQADERRWRGNELLAYLSFGKVPKLAPQGFAVVIEKGLQDLPLARGADSVFIHNRRGDQHRATVAAAQGRGGWSPRFGWPECGAVFPELRRDVCQDWQLFDVVDSCRQRASDDLPGDVGGDQRCDPGLFTAGQGGGGVSVAVVAVDADREPARSDVDTGENLGEGFAESFGPECADALQTEEQRGERCGVQAQPCCDGADPQRATQAVLIGEAERVGGAGVVAGQGDAERLGSVRVSPAELADGPADGVEAVVFACAQEHGDVESVGPAEGLVDLPCQQVGESRCDADAQYGGGSAVVGEVCHCLHLAEEPVGGADVDEVDSLAQAGAGQGAVGWFDAEDDRADRVLA